MWPHKPIRCGLVLRTHYGLDGKPQKPHRLDKIEVYAVPFDNVQFAHSTGPTWHQRGTYDVTDPDFRGYGQEFANCVNDDTVPQTEYYVYMDGVGYFRTLEDYYKFIQGSLRSVIVEEIWEDEK